MAASLPYREPDIQNILIYASFILLLNIVNRIVDKIAYCGLIGQILLGIAWDSPGANLLGKSAEHVFVQLGYLGLILLVYEGGLSTSFKSVKANIYLSIGIALTGICLPIGFSYSLLALVDATPLQSFAAGASLCSTSLGTTFTVLSTTGLSKTRMGVVLSSAAMLDDVVGLVMVQVIANLGTNDADFDPVSVIRPVFVSFGFMFVVPLAARFIVKPLTLHLNNLRQQKPDGRTNKILSKQEFAFFVHTSTLIALVVGASYEGTSNLFAAYLAGASISWWNSEVPHFSAPVDQSQTAIQVAQSDVRSEPQGEDSTEMGVNVVTSEPPNTRPTSVESSCQKHPQLSSEIPEGTTIYEEYYKQVVNKILRPFFFASIGFSIPISNMFTGALIWRGIVFTILMVVSKLVCGLWLVRISWHSTVPPQLQRLKTLVPMPNLLWCVLRPNNKSKEQKPDEPGVTPKIDQRVGDKTAFDELPPKKKPRPKQQRETDVTEQVESNSKMAHGDTSVHPHQTPAPPKPMTLYPAGIVGSAMVARGEIGFLISSIAESNGIFGQGPDSDVFLVVTWAILLCTIIGPISVGLLVHHVKRLEERRVNDTEEEYGPLGVWKVS